MLSSITVYEQVHVFHGQDDAHTTHTVNMTAMHEMAVATNQKPEETKMLTMVTLLQQCLKEMSSEKCSDFKRTAEYLLSPSVCGTDWYWKLQTCVSQAFRALLVIGDLIQNHREKGFLAI